ncbi:hypothetical protein N2152v2_008482 [Parachlorella kessleri]
MSPSERDETIKDPRLEAGFQVLWVCVLALGHRSVVSSSQGAQLATEQLAGALRKARWLSAPVGAIAGLFGSVVGVGGGVVIVPMIVSACRSIPQRVVSGTSLAAVVSTALVSSATYAQGGLVDPLSALLISPVAMLAAPWGAKWTARLDCAALRRALGWFLLVAAPLVPLKAVLLQGREGSLGVAQQGTAGQQIQERLALSDPSAIPRTLARPSAAPPSQAVAAPAETAAVSAGMPAGLPGSRGSAAQLASSAPPAEKVQQEPQEPSLEDAKFMLQEFWRQQARALTELAPAKAAALCMTGAVAGFASGLLGIGGGTIVTPLLALTMTFGQATVLGTSLFSMLLPSLSALAQHHRMGNVDWRMAGGLALGTALGGTVGSKAAVQAPPGVLEAAFTLGMLFLGRKTLQSARR